MNKGPGGHSVDRQAEAPLPTLQGQGTRRPSTRQWGLLVEGGRLGPGPEHGDLCGGHYRPPVCHHRPPAGRCGPIPFAPGLPTASRLTGSESRGLGSTVAPARLNDPQGTTSGAWPLPKVLGQAEDPAHTYRA